MDPSAVSPFPIAARRLPGYGVPLDHYAKDENNKGFDHPLLSTRGAGPILPVREYEMMEFMNRVTDKVEWEEKVYKDEIVEEWRRENVDEQGGEEGGDRDFSLEMFEWCIKELRHKATEYKRTQFVEALDGVHKSDTIIPEDLRQALVHAVKPLEDIPEGDKDWHPGSENLVLDLVHPSLYPLVYGQSKILPDGVVTRDDCLRRAGEGETVPVPQEPQQKNIWSTKYQWLPTEFSNDKETGTVKALGYINNLRPDQYNDLYGIIEKIIAKSIPLWSATLTAARQRDQILPRLKMEDDGYAFPPGVPKDFHADVDDPDCDNKYQQWAASRVVLGPEPYLDSIEARFDETQESSIIDLACIPRLQITVKLANIHLTPDGNARYDGGSWHVEGQANEQICASALYYYDSTNVSDALLALRKDLDEECEMDLPYEQDDHRALQEIYGFEQDEAKVQGLGKVVTRPGRLVTFPNILQHRVESFGLRDQSKPGHRKLLALFLVDPFKPILSTSHVPPQQENVWKSQVRGLGPLGELPTELNLKIMDMVDTFPVTAQRAKDQRRELMDERKFYQNYQEEKVWQLRTFSLCEH